VDDAFRATVTVSKQREASEKAGSSNEGDLAKGLPIAGALAIAAGMMVALRRERRAGGGLAPWLAPAFALVSVLLVYPMLELVRLAFTDASTNGERYRYTLDSFRRLASGGDIASMLAVTAVFVAVSVIGQIACGLGIALLVDAAKRRGAKGTIVARLAVVSAWIIPGVLVGIVWKILLVESRAGIANYLLSFVGIGPLGFLSNGALAQACVAFANVWRGAAFSMVLLFAGLQRIPKELVEAADLEGVSFVQRMRYVIIPQLVPVLGLNLALVTIYTVATFDFILPLTGGGPARSTEVISLAMYRAAFARLEAGPSAAIAMLMLAINLTLALVAARVVLRREESR
jgi:multiple sugar transport system permease protein